jgi:hypothetical protein
VILENKMRYLTEKIYSLQIYPSYIRQGGGKKSWVSHPPFRGNNRHLGAFGKQFNVGNQVGRTSSSIVQVLGSKKWNKRHGMMNANP